MGQPHMARHAGWLSKQTPSLARFHGNVIPALFCADDDTACIWLLSPVGIFAGKNLPGKSEMAQSCQLLFTLLLTYCVFALCQMGQKLFYSARPSPFSSTWVCFILLRLFVLVNGMYSIVHRAERWNAGAGFCWLKLYVPYCTWPTPPHFEVLKLLCVFIIKCSEIGHNRSLQYITVHLYYKTEDFQLFVFGEVNLKVAGDHSIQSRWREKGLQDGACLK